MMRRRTIPANARAFLIWRTIEKHGHGVLTLSELADELRMPISTVGYVVRARGWGNRLTTDPLPDRHPLGRSDVYTLMGVHPQLRGRE